LLFSCVLHGPESAATSVNEQQHSSIEFITNTCMVFPRIYCTILGVLTRFCPIIVQVTPLKTPFGLVTSFITIPITRSYSHTQLLLTPLHNYNPRAFMPTITYCTVTLLTIDPLCCRSSILRLDSFFSCQLLTAVFAGWLID
jgi:cellulose synthase/poly-beta-1,6-N-acetylglucosamine synthase-like glycosyltransferase